MPARSPAAAAATASAAPGAPGAAAPPCSRAWPDPRASRPSRRGVRPLGRRGGRDPVPPAPGPHQVQRPAPGDHREPARHRAAAGLEPRRVAPGLGERLEHRPLPRRPAAPRSGTRPRRARRRSDRTAPRWPARRRRAARRDEFAVAGRQGGRVRHAAMGRRRSRDGGIGAWNSLRVYTPPWSVHKQPRSREHLGRSPRVNSSVAVRPPYAGPHDVHLVLEALAQHEARDPRPRAARPGTSARRRSRTTSPARSAPIPREAHRAPAAVREREASAEIARHRRIRRRRAVRRGTAAAKSSAYTRMQIAAAPLGVLRSQLGHRGVHRVGPPRRARAPAARSRARAMLPGRPAAAIRPRPRPPPPRRRPRAAGRPTARVRRAKPCQRAIQAGRGPAPQRRARRAGPARCRC